ncbi:MAG: hypothetical protein GY913_22410 [Proteobacteria bacterium]|nr:hypothetical protein [Pseudomonadota bacterium]MCP4919663.1 hypothetical protein [Pseudomonadota bacterium]
MTDLARLARALDGIEDDAKSLSWNAERPWKPSSHLWVEGHVPVVDLHDLSIKLALEVTERVIQIAEELESGAVHFITGRGKHAIDGRSRLREAVGEVLLEATEDREWDLREPRAGRITLIVDAEVVPPAAKGSLDWWVWGILAAFLALAVYAAPMVGVPLMVVVLAWVTWNRFLKS